VSLKNAQSHQSWEISGLPHGSVTNPPLIDLKRRIVVGYDSANRHLRAWKIKSVQNENEHDVELTPLWHHENFGAASHMLLFSNTANCASMTTAALTNRCWCWTLKLAKKKPASKPEGSCRAWYFQALVGTEILLVFYGPSFAHLRPFCLKNRIWHV
jgi:hypothetical protein